MASRSRGWRLAGLVLLLPAVACPAAAAQEVDPPTRSPAAPQAVVRWLGENAVRLATVEAGHGFEDMKPLRRMVGDARVVALGEATHGSRELFQHPSATFTARTGNCTGCWSTWWRRWAPLWICGPCRRRGRWPSGSPGPIGPAPSAPPTARPGLTASSPPQSSPAATTPCCSWPEPPPRPNPGGRRPGHPPRPRAENPGFEAGPAGGAPPGWRVPAEQADYGFTVTTGEESPYPGERCAILARAPGQGYGEAYGRLSQTVDATPFQGAPVRLRAAVEAQLPGPGDRAYLWLRVRRRGFGPDAVAAFERLPVAAGGWRELEIVARVPPDAATLAYGLALVGHGRAGLDAVSIAAEPEPPPRP